MNIGKNVKKFGVQNKNMIVALILVAFAIAVYFFYQLSNKFDARADKYCCLC